MEGRIGSSEAETLETDLEHILEAMRRPLGGREEVTRPRDRAVRNRRSRRPSPIPRLTENSPMPQLAYVSPMLRLVYVSNSRLGLNQNDLDSIMPAAKLRNKLALTDDRQHISPEFL